MIFSIHLHGPSEVSETEFEAQSRTSPHSAQGGPLRNLSPAKAASLRIRRAGSSIVWYSTFEP